MKKTLSILLTVLLLLSVLSGCGATSQNVPKTVGEVIDVVYPYDQTVTLHTKKQENYLTGNYNGIIISTGKKELSRPEAVAFSWKYNGESAENVQYTLKISEHADMTDCTTYTTTDDFFAVYNLKIAATYRQTETALCVLQSAVFRFMFPARPHTANNNLQNKQVGVFPQV